MRRWQFTLRSLFLFVTASAFMAMLWRYEILLGVCGAFAFIGLVYFLGRQSVRDVQP